MTDNGRVSSLRRELGDGLILRSARYDDGAELVDFNATMHADAGLPGSTLAEWTRDLFETPHPTFRIERDVTVVEDTASGRIVSALFLIPQVWSYAGVPLKAGQPELIATHPDYRRRGLVRAQFEVIHDWSRAGGQLWQFIAGIAWYYRQFGYTYAVDLPPRPILWLGEAPSPSTEFSLRTATHNDVAFLAELEAQAPSGTTLGPLRGRDGFTLELARRPGGLLACEILVIESTTEPTHRSATSPINVGSTMASCHCGLSNCAAVPVGSDPQLPSSPICTDSCVITPTVPGEVFASPCQLDIRRHAVRRPSSVGRPPARTGCTSGYPM